jgi:hypothetical protein
VEFKDLTVIPLDEAAKSEINWLIQNLIVWISYIISQTYDRKLQRQRCKNSQRHE